MPGLRFASVRRTAGFTSARHQVPVVQEAMPLRREDRSGAGGAGFAILVDVKRPVLGTPVAHPALVHVVGFHGAIAGAAIDVPVMSVSLRSRRRSRKAK